MSLAPPRGSRMSMSGMFAGPPMANRSMPGRPSLGGGGLFGAPQGQMGPGPQMPPSMPPPQMGPQMPSMPSMPQAPNFPPVMPSAGNPGPAQPAMPAGTQGYESGQQAYGHPILLPSITALMTGIATSRPPDPNMMWDTSTGKWTSDLSAYSGRK